MRHGFRRALSLPGGLHALIGDKHTGHVFVKHNDTEIKRSPPVWERLKAGFIEAHRRRPLSFYLLLPVPFVLMFGAHAFRDDASPHRFVLVLTLMLIFFWLISAWALNDLFSLYRKHRAARRTVYLETIGDPEFAERLGSEVRKRQGRH